jgi:hypothetical protein
VGFVVPGNGERDPGTFFRVTTPGMYTSMKGWRGLGRGELGAGVSWRRPGEERGDVMWLWGFWGKEEKGRVRFRFRRYR